MQAEGKKVTKERWHRVEGLHRGVIGGEERSRGGGDDVGYSAPGR